MKIYHLQSGPLRVNSYFLVNNENKAIVIDSGENYKKIKQTEQQLGVEIKAVLLTHAHFDHILEIDSWVNATGAKVLVGEADRCALSDPVRNCYSMFLGTKGGYFGDSMPLSDNSHIPLGDDFIKVISLPGHTPGGIGLYFNDTLIVGDTVFAAGFGRYDLPGGDFDALKGSIKRVFSYPRDTLILPGHGEGAQISIINKHFPIFNL